MYGIHNNEDHLIPQYRMWLFFCSSVHQENKPMVNISTPRGSRSLDMSQGTLNPHSQLLTAFFHCPVAINALCFLNREKKYCVVITEDLLHYVTSR